jgi:hypothetical protein
MKSMLCAIPLFALLASSALAQVPVADVAREAKETQTAGCVARAATSKGATLQPAQGVKGSMIAPSVAGPSAQVGASNVTGLGSIAGSAVGDADFGNFISASILATKMLSASSLAPSSAATVRQVVNGLSAVTSAVQTNGPSLLGASATIGSVATAQAAWSQNTGARIGAASIWGQAIQVGSLSLQLRNLMLLQQAAKASGQAQVMTYDAAAAVLVGGAPTVADNSVTTPLQSPNYAAVAEALSAGQKAPAVPASPQPHLAGVVPQRNLASSATAPSASQ